MVTELPGQADSFVDSVGADSRFTPGMAETVNFAASSAALYASGIRHLRDGTSTAYQTMETIATHGIKHSIGFGSVAGYGSSVLTAAAIKSSLLTEAKNLDFVEASNEYDNSGDPNWAAALRGAQTLLYTTVRANPAWSKIAVLAPALENPKNATVLGAVPSDGGNLHNATCDFNPATSNRSVSMLAQQTNLFAESGNVPVWTTETGYDNTPTSSCYISQDGAAKYIPRTIAYRWNSGMPHSYFDSWSDENAVSFANMGFVTQAGIPKKQYYAVQSLLQMLSDPGPAHPTVPVAYTFSGATTNVMHTLLQKRHGTYYLLIWQEVPSWNHQLKTPIVVPPAEVTITFAGNTAPGVYAYAYAPNYALVRTPFVSVTRKAVVINVTDSIQVIQFHTAS